MPDRHAPAPAPHACRTLFLSDLHLGALGARSDLALSFLEAHRAETYVLAGDVLDLWQPLLPHWTDADQAVIDHLNARKAEGAALIYLRGNHDPYPERAPEAARPHAEALDRCVHEAADGRRYLVIHGDALDRRVFRAHVFTRIGSRIDHGLRLLDRGLKRLRLESPGEARSSIEALLAWLNSLMHARRKHEKRLVELARSEGFDGIICGHFHMEALHDEHGLIYANCGDWVDSITALAEAHDGTLQLLSGWRDAATDEAEQGSSLAEA